MPLSTHPIDEAAEHSHQIYMGDKWDRVWLELKQNDDLNYLDPTRDTSISALMTSSLVSIHEALTEGWTMMLGYSSGKDSECLLHLFLIALIRAVRNGANVSQHHFIIHTDTLIESPEVRWLADKKLSRLEDFIQRENLPLTIIRAKPSLTQSWTGRILTGRGLPTFSNSSMRQCSNDFKITPAKRAKTAYMRNLPAHMKDKVCLLLGSRDAESATRAASIAKQNGSCRRVVKTKVGGELYVIKDWLASDVWELLMNSGSGTEYPLPSYLDSNRETAELYKAATGECIWTATEKRTSDACGARFGCWACQAVRADKSMEALLVTDPEQHGYLAGLNRLQRFISKRRYAWEDRHPVGRTIYEGGYIKIQPDVYNPQMLERLLHVCCSLDLAEQERAEQVAEQLERQEIEPTERNVRMSSPQFRIVTEEAIIHIDFMWSFHHFNAHPFRALEIYHRVWSFRELDLLDDEPDCAVVPQTPIPKPVWVRVPRWGNGSLSDGLADPLSEMTYFDGGDEPLASRVINTSDGKRRVISFIEDDEVKVDPDSASFIVWQEYPRLREGVLKGHYTPGSAAQFYLRFGVVQLAKGKGAMYHKMMQRGQTYHAMGLSGTLTLEQISARRDIKVINDKQYHDLIYRKIKAKLKKEQWWWIMGQLIELHQTHRTQIGKWIDDTLAHDKSMEDTALQEQWFNMLNDRLLAVIDAFCMRQLVDKQSQAGALFRYYKDRRRHAISVINALLKQTHQDLHHRTITDVLWELRMIQDRLSSGSVLETHLEWTKEFSKTSPLSLARHVKVIILGVKRLRMINGG